MCAPKNTVYRVRIVFLLKNFLTLGPSASVSPCKQYFCPQISEKSLSSAKIVFLYKKSAHSCRSLRALSVIAEHQTNKKRK